MTETKQTTLTGSKTEIPTFVLYDKRGKATEHKYEPPTEADPNDPSIV